MLYINYTAPDGKTYHIENPVFTYVCPTCGETTLFQFSDEFFECAPCNERQEKVGFFRRKFEQLRQTS